MEKIHITLVGGQPAPVYHGIIAVKPDKVIYIYSSSSQKALNALKREIAIPSDEIELDVTSPEEIKRCAESLAKDYAEAEVSVNISSGLKSWSHWFGVIFQQKENAAVIYIDQNNRLWNYRTMQSRSDFNFDMHALFRLYGNSLENFVPFKDYTTEDFNAVSMIEEVRRFNNDVFNALTINLDKKRRNKLKGNKKDCFIEGRSQVEWNKDDSQITLLVYDRKERKKEKTIKSPHVVSLLFNAAWFELKVAKILSGWEHAEEICMNCRFPFKQGLDKNEVDIIVNTGVKNLFVECKTQIYDTTAIDKFRSVIRSYGGMGSKGLFVTDAPMTEMAKAKCEEYGIITFSIQEYHLGMEPDQALFWLLNSELFNINAK